MSRQLRYEEIDQQWADMPMPGAEAGWQKMQELLDKEDDGKRLLPPMSLQGCFGWSLLLVAAIAVTWIVVKNGTWNNTTEKTKNISTLTNNPSANTRQALLVVADSSSTMVKKTKQAISNTEPGKQTLKHTSLLSPGKWPPTVTTGDAITHKVPVNKNSLSPSSDKTAGVRKKDQDSASLNTDSIIVVNKETNNKVLDSVGTIPLQASIPQKKQEIRKTFVLSAGIVEQQLIPVDGQTAVPYSYYGRKGSLRDYIPSLYLRMQKENKWYVQAEFRYGAPQSVKEFSYNRRTMLDSTGMNLVTTTLRLKKTYYHQLPLSFNYYITPALSVGAGGIYSRFFAAVTEQEVKTQNVQTQAETVYTKIIPINHYTDSFLYKTQIHFLVQADYQWKRFYWGLRYTRDLQPYIRFISPDGKIEEEKNQTLQVIAGFRIWRGKR